MKQTTTQKGTTMQKANENLIAESYGIAAFEMGKPAVPALDENLMKMLEGLSVGQSAADLMKAWVSGWTQANLAAPVDF